MSRIRPFPLFLAVLCLAASALPAAAVPYGTPFVLTPGTSVVVGEEGLVVGFDGILSDGRCPTGVLCFWPGDAAASLNADAPWCDAQQFVLHTYYDYDRSAELCQVVVHLLLVEPYPVFDGPPIDPADYVVTLMVEEAGPVETVRQSWGTVKSIYR